MGILDIVIGTTEKSVEDITLQIKRYFDDKLIYVEEDQVVVDFINISEDDPYLIDDFIKNTIQFDNIIKDEIKFKFKKKMKISYLNIPNQDNISDIRTEHLGKLVKVTGMISNVSMITSRTTFSFYECRGCGTVVKVKGIGKPKKCSCQSTGLRLINKDREDSQDLIIEESQEDIGDRNPKKVRLRLTDELCDKEFNNVVRDGNKLEVFGVVEVIPMKIDPKLNEELSYFRINAIQIKSLENEFDETITDEDIKYIEQISKNKPLELLANSLNSDIIGRMNEKKALVLSSVGACPKTKADGRIDTGRIHTLLIGDASTGKSELLQALAKKHFKGIYRGFEKMTESGLCGGAMRDELTGIWQLKTGVLPRASGGILIGDEIDKMSLNVQKLLHTPMQSGFCSVSFIGSSVNLKADATIVLGANPKNSRFDPLKPLPQQINMSDTLLSRFTLIMTMRDEINTENDKIVADSVWGKNDGFDDEEIIGTNIFRKYIKYTQQFNPKPTKEVKDIINNFYIDIRQKTQKRDNIGEAIPIVVRQLHGLKKLAEASARIRLSNIVEEEDAHIAIDIYKYTLEKLGMNIDNSVDFAKIYPGVLLSIKEKRENLLKFIKDKDEEKGFIVDEELIEYSKKMKIEKLELDKLLDGLREEGLIFSPKNGQYRYLG